MVGQAMRLAGAAAVFISCAVMGFSLSDRLKKRARYIGNIIEALSLLETEIAFGQSRVREAFLRVDTACDTRGLFKTAAERIEKSGIKKAWRGAVEEKKDELRLTGADAEAVIALGERLGMTDTENQIKNIRYVKGRLEPLLKEAEGEYGQAGRLYRGGGILVGLFLILILL